MDCCKEAKPPREGTGVPSMMKEMMRKMGGTGELSPAAMCRAMMTPEGSAADMGELATPEVRTLFQAWARSVEDEVLAALKTKGPLDLVTLAGAAKITPENALYFVGKLIREGKATIGSIQATGG